MKGHYALYTFSLHCYRAMEERKKAAIEAEEQRRKKALEERRRAQLEATERFKVVVGKLKTVPKKPKSKDVDGRLLMLCSLVA